MKTYFKIIAYTQQLLLGASIALLALLPSALVFRMEWFTEAVMLQLYATAHVSLLFVMSIRPLADIFRGVPWIRPLVILRKGAGVLSASIIVSFILEKIILDPSGFVASFGSPAYWSLTNLALLAHLADITAIILLVTSNNLSKRILGKAWKRIQRLSYVYFYASSLYLILIIGNTSIVWYVYFVTSVTLIAYARNHGYIMQTHNKIAA